MQRTSTSLAEYGEVSNLIPIQVGSEEATVNARDLWNYLESGKQFSDWVTKRLDALGAIQGKDFFTEQRKTGGRPSTEYIVTIDLAKHMAMVEKNDKGYEVREYFLAAEKRLRSLRGEALDVPKDPLALFRYALEAIEQNREETAQFKLELVSVKAANAQLEQRLDDQPISAHADKRNHIYNLVHELGSALGGTYHVGLTWRRFKAYYNLSKYDALPVKRYPEAVELLTEWIRKAREGDGLFN